MGLLGLSCRPLPPSFSSRLLTIRPHLISPSLPLASPVGPIAEFFIRSHLLPVRARGRCHRRLRAGPNL
ncbi:hypothetical protein FQA47_006009 [Oryzias melastigma]|uniref:Uncharacterized protein n=1 Tax=Oryzias melastigma TaxID=30732 RepID=A0A834CCU0_ORYME|nr:hypothetical protein FQA47_006009 [Oryzias melastigma]